MKQTKYLAKEIKILFCVIGMTALIFTACKSASNTALTPQSKAEASNVVFDVESVTLNYGTHSMEVRGKLRNNGTTKPEKVWVWAYFFAPNSQYASGSWSGSPIELDNPFASGNEANVTATGHFHWWDNSYTPKSGYYARVNVSAQTSDASMIPSEQRNKTAAGAYTVRVIQ